MTDVIVAEKTVLVNRRERRALKKILRRNIGTHQERMQASRLLNRSRAWFVAPGQFRVPSQWRYADTNKPTAWHTVNLLDDQGAMTCSCPWSAHNPDQDCTHIETVRHRLRREAAYNRFRFYPPKDVEGNFENAPQTP